MQLGRWVSRQRRSVPTSKRSKSSSKHRLFIRHSRSVRLTPQGARLLPGVQRGMSELSRAVDQLRRDRTSGLLNITSVGFVPAEMVVTPTRRRSINSIPELDLRFNASPEVIDFMSTDFHAAVRYGRGAWPQVRAEKMLDDWVFPVASPSLVAKLGPIETLGDFNKYPLLHSSSEPWVDWMRRVGGDTTRLERGPVLDDSASVLTAAEQGLGMALARWSLVAGDLARTARSAVEPKRAATTFVLFPRAAPEIPLPKVLRFRDWLREVCSQFPPPEGERLEPSS